MKRSDVPFTLPRGVRPKFGALYLIENVKVADEWKYLWHRLCAIADGQAAMYTALGKIKAKPVHRNFRESIERFKTQYLPGCSASWRKEADRMLEVIAQAFEDFDVDGPDAADVIAFTDQFKSALAAAHHYKAMLSTFFRWSIGKRLRQDNPCREVWLDKPKKKKLIWTPEIFHKVRDAMLVSKDGRKNSAGPMMQCYMDLSFLIYQRATDVRLLRWSQIRNGVIYFQPTKTRESSGVQLEVEITPEIQVVLDRARQLARVKPIRSGDAFVIQTKGGSAFTRSGIYSAFLRAGERVDLKGINPKSLRPFAATQAKKAGYTLEELQEGLGHTNISTTEGYVRKHEIRHSIVRMTLPVKTQ